MVEKVDTVSADGVKSDGVSFYPALPEQLQSFRDASEALSRFQAPVLAHANNPHERIFMAAFDGTGNDADKDPEHATNIDKIRKQVEALSESGEKQVHVEYLAGPWHPGRQAGPYLGWPPRTCVDNKTDKNSNYVSFRNNMHGSHCS